MKKAMKLVLAVIGFVSCAMTNAEAANSITYTVGGWQITLTDLGLLPGGTASSALAINNLGHIVGLATDSTFALQRPLWDANTGAIIGMADNFDPASTAVPEHLNDNGEMAGTEVIRTGTLYEGVHWNSAGQAFRLPSMAGVDPLYGSVHVYGHGINNLGQMVGASKASAPTFFLHAVLWPDKDTPPQDLGFLGKGAYVDYSEALGINDLGHVVGNGALGAAIRGFLWRNGRMIDLGSLSGTASEGTAASAVNNRGLVVGKSNFYPVIWKYDVANSSSTPGIQQLPIPSEFFAALPTAVNDSADVAGYAGSPNIDAHAILWRNGQAIDLGVWPGGHYSVANGINNLGQIVGTGTIAGDNLDHALMWTVAPVGGGGGGGGTTNTTPSASLQATSSTLIRAGRSFSVQASFADPDNGPWSYKLNWGDGTATVGNTSNPGTISGIGPHVYAKPGSFGVKLTVTDGKGAAGSSKTITVRVR
jgi:probable HAF family extracellular repeat protein